MSVLEARLAVESFFESFNARDNDGVRAALNFPHVRIASGRVTVAANASEFEVPFDALVRAEGWRRSTLDRAEVVHQGPDKVHFDVGFSRYREDGSRYARYTSLWVVTRQRGHWGVQARSSYAP